MTSGPTDTPFDVLDDRADDLNDDLADEARDYLEAWDRWMYGVSPSGAAAAAYYLATCLERDLVDGRPPTQDDVGDLFGTSAVTIRKWHPDIFDAVDPWNQD